MPIGVSKAKEYDLTKDHWQALLNGINWTVEHLIEDIATFRHDDHIDIEHTWIVQSLPELYRPLYTLVFLKQFLACVLTVAWKLCAPRRYRLASVAEELALHIIIESAKADLDIAGIQADFGSLYDLAYEDNDFLMLFDRKFDGVEDTDIGKQAGIVNLRFRDWFKPFRPDEPINPYCYDEARPTNQSS